MKKYRCTVCEYIYDPALGDPENGIAPGTAFEDLPDGWICPVCGEGKWAFEPLEEQKKTTKTMLNLIVSLLILPLMATDTAKQVRFTPKDLPYAYDALAPQVSEETLRFHHDKHYVGYVNKLNELIVDTPYAEQPLEDIVVSADGAIFNNAAQMWNHEFFFDELSPKAQTRPTGALLKAIDENFGSFDQLKAQMEKAAAGVFGSGWVWLAEDKSGKLAIVSEQNAGNPLRYGMKPLMCFDVWEHAYYIDYRNRRADAVAALWDRIDWKVVEERYAKE